MRLPNTLMGYITKHLKGTSQRLGDGRHDLMPEAAEEVKTDARRVLSIGSLRHLVHRALVFRPNEKQKVFFFALKESTKSDEIRVRT